MANVRRDFQSGENIACILNLHYIAAHGATPAGFIDLKQLNGGTSFQMRDSNWALIRKFLSRPENSYIVIPSDELNGVIHGKAGAAEVVVMRLYQYFTGHRIKTLVGEYNFDFT